MIESYLTDEERRPSRNSRERSVVAILPQPIGEGIAPWETEPTDVGLKTIDVVDKWADDVLSRKRPKLFAHAAYGSRLKEFEIGGGMVTVVAAPPAGRKTALITQVQFDALQADESVRVLIANVEMSPAAILDRQLSRLTGVGHAWIRHRDYEEAVRPRLELGIDELRALAPRLHFMSPPFETERLAEQADAFDANIISVDYAQRFDSKFRSKDQRSQCNVVMDACRRIADGGRAVIVVSAVNRQGYNRETAGLASFRESSELEYGADNAWLVIGDEKDADRVTLRCVKNRHGKIVEIPLLFDGSRMSFTDDTSGLEWNG